MLFEHRINRNITLSFNAIYWNNTSIMHLYYKFWFNLFFRCYSVCNLFIYFFSLLEKKILPFFQNHIFFLVFKISNKFDNKIEVTLIENKFNTKKEKVIQNFDNRIILQIFNYFRFIANYMLFCVVLEFFFFFNYIIFGIILVMFGKFLSFNEYNNIWLCIEYKTLGLYAFKYYPIYTSVL